MDATDESGRTAMMFAAELGHPAAVRLLADRAADVSLRDLSGESAMDKARNNNHGNVTSILDQVLVENVHDASRLGDVDGLERLIKAGADVNARDERGRMPIHHTTNDEYTARGISILARYGADLDALDPDGYTPLHSAVTRVNLDAVDLLIQGGANVDVRARRYGSRTAWEYALGVRNSRSAIALLANGVNPPSLARSREAYIRSSRPELSDLLERPVVLHELSQDELAEVILAESFEGLQSEALRRIHNRTLLIEIAQRVGVDSEPVNASETLLGIN